MLLCRNRIDMVEQKAPVVPDAEPEQSEQPIERKCASRERYFNKRTHVL